MSDEMWFLVDEGFTVTALRIDGKLVITASTDGISLCGIGNTQEEAWAVLRSMAQERNVSLLAQP